MKLNEANEILKAHNEWRRHRDDESRQMPHDPKELGQAIDTLTRFVGIVTGEPSGMLCVKGLDAFEGIEDDVPELADVNGIQIHDQASRKRSE